MYFFRNQERARRKTGLLILLFALAVGLIVLAVNLVFYALLMLQEPPSRFVPLGSWLLTRPSLICSGVVVLVLLAGSLVRYLALRQGGRAVARMVGARPIPSNATEPGEKRLRNIVEEMAIASGVTQPALYVMDSETSINAFVAGYQANESVMVVTRGAMDELTRDELQGVVGHEFSHILNGDMRINVRTIAILAGILMIGQIGQFLLRISIYSGRSRSRDSRGAIPVFLAGLALTVIGYIGVFFGRLIKSAIARQREFLADAAAVQFTRNPEGIGGALYKVGLNPDGARLQATSHAEDLNHMCFGEAVKLRLAGLLASHPPLEDRIKAIEPALWARLKARYGRAGLARTKADAGASQPPEAAAGFTSGQSQPLSPQAPPSETVGSVTPASEAYAAQLLASLPADLHHRLHEPGSAVQFTYGLMAGPAELAKMPTPGASTLPAPDEALIGELRQQMAELGPAYRLPCLEMALPALRELDQEGRRALIDQLTALARADGRLTLHEMAVLAFLTRHLGDRAGYNQPVRHHSYRPLRKDLALLFWLMVRAGGASDEPARELFSQVMGSFASGTPAPAAEACSVRELLRALKRLRGLTPLLKPAVIDACADCVRHDGLVTVREYELLRLVADQLDCPMPPLTQCAAA